MPFRSPETLTQAEQQAVLRVTTPNVRDHALLSLALGTGLRLAELVGLNIGDVYAADGSPKSRIRIRPQIAKNGRAGDVFVPDKLRPKLVKLWAFKKRRQEGIGPTDPLFCSQSRRRLSKRRVQFSWHQWQRRAELDRIYPFHSLRHSAVTNVYRATRDLFLAQRFARHASPLTTTIYTHPGDEEMQQRLRGLVC